VNREVIYKKGDLVIYLGKTILPKHDIHMHLKSLLTKGKTYKLDGDVIYASNTTYVVHMWDDRNEVGGYEIESKNLVSLHENRDTKLNLLLND
jgi:hypothetical protein